MADYDPNIELNPNGILIGTALLVLAGFATVWLIVSTGEAKTPAPAAETAQQ